MSSCIEQTALGADESFVTIWSGDQCNGDAMMIPFDTSLPGSQVLESDQIGNPTTIGFPDLTSFRVSSITGVWSPPHFDTILYSQPKYQGASMYVRHGELRSNLNSPNYGVGAGQTKSIKIILLASWADTKFACCIGDSSVSSKTCKTYWGPNQVFDEEYRPGMPYPASDCDDIMQKWCRQNAGDPICSCITSGIQDLAACHDNNCINKSGYLTSAHRAIYNVGCPNNVVCQQFVTIGDQAINNTLKANMYQICPGSAPAPPLTGTGSRESTSTSNSSNSPNSPTTTITQTQTITDNSGGENAKATARAGLGIFPLSEEQRLQLFNTFGENYEIIIIIGIMAIVILITTGGEKRRPPPMMYPPPAFRPPY